MSGAHEGLRLGLLATATGLGFRHGIDWDHIAAITDLAAAQDRPGAALGSATSYFVGHGLVVGVLGAMAIIAGEHVPASVDHVMEKLVGATLVALGVYVLSSLVLQGRDFRMRSRWMLIFSGIRQLAGWTRQRKLVSSPQSPTTSVEQRPRGGHYHPEQGGGSEGGYWGTSGALTSIAVGALHGIGAETPTQVLLLAAAASAGGAVPGMLLLGAFVLGLFLANSVVGLMVAFGFLGASRNFVVYATVRVFTGMGGLVVGLLLLTGGTNVLPSLLAG